MRYLAETFALGALKRGRTIEQFLGPAGPSRRGIRYVEILPGALGYEVVLHALEDIGHEGFVDLVEFPPLEPVDESEEFGRLLGVFEDALIAVTAAEELTGAVRARWVNAGVSQDEYLDYVKAGRPATHSPDGHPWPGSWR